MAIKGNEIKNSVYYKEIYSKDFSLPFFEQKFKGKYLKEFFKENS